MLGYDHFIKNNRTYECKKSTLDNRKYSTHAIRCAHQYTRLAGDVSLHYKQQSTQSVISNQTFSIIAHYIHFHSLALGDCLTFPIAIACGVVFPLVLIAHKCLDVFIKAKCGVRCLCVASELDYVALRAICIV